MGGTRLTSRVTGTGFSSSVCLGPTLATKPKSITGAGIGRYMLCAQVSSSASALYLKGFRLGILCNIEALKLGS